MKKTVVLAGNPNVGKSTLFNQLTGSQQKIANYPGVTVEKHSGTLCTVSGQTLTIIDLPGTYSLNTKTEDEAVAARSIAGTGPGGTKPDVVVVLVEATKLGRALLLYFQIKQIHSQVILAVNMMDELAQFKMHLDVKKLSDLLCVPVVPIVARSGIGLQDLIAEIEKMPALSANSQKSQNQEHEKASDDQIKDEFKRIDAIVLQVLTRVSEKKGDPLSDKLDRFLLHPVLGPAIFMVIMFLVFQALFSWSTPLADMIDGGVSILGDYAKANIALPWLASLVSDGVVAGVGSVLVFVPQIAIMFLLIGFLEMSGYLARGAFLIDRFMRLFGLEGRAFIPMISSFACAIPGILSTRTIPNPRQRLITTLIAPLMTCSARLPVYTLLIACFIPATRVMGVISLQALSLFGLFLAGIFMAMVMALVFNKVLPKKSGTTSFFMELPRYRLPALKTLLNYIFSRTKAFLKTAGTVIFVLSVILWALAYFPRPASVAQKFESQREQIRLSQISEDEKNMQLDEIDRDESGTYLRDSFMGHAGRFIEPALRPMGFDWKLGIGVLASFAAREVFVSTMGIVFNIGDADETSQNLRQKLQSAQTEDGKPAYTLATALALMVFYAFAAQCFSTLATIRRETNSTRWPVFAFVYMTVLAYIAATVVYQVMSRV